MILRFWGTRGSIPSPGLSTVKFGGNTTCLELTLSDGTLVIFDAGTGIRKLGNSIVQNHRNGAIHLFLTHSHWDHIQGFPFFLPAYSEKVAIKIFGCPPAFNKLKEILTSQMESSYFPVNFHDLKANISFEEIQHLEEWVKNAHLSFIRNNHPGASYGFRIEEANKRLVFITDNELMPGNNSAQTSWHDFIDFCRDADVLIHDAQYLQEEMLETTGFGHSSYEQVFQLGLEANAKHLIFFHHEPDRSDEEIDQIIEQYRQKRDRLQSPMKLDAAAEGATYKI
ncbi:MAG: MBL fold metallo-hydrolase [candidate division KSB1 bacterium]|nr:MBL fold metallo-hydrolase [candidate division KSB1 bacterium]